MLTDSDIVREVRKQRARLARASAKNGLLYLTGTFTPALAGSGVAGTFTYDAANTYGQYTRIGNRVLFDARVRITAITVAPTLDLRITGLPITSASGGVPGGITFHGWTGITFTAGYADLSGRILGGLTYVEVMQSGSAVGQAKIQGGALALVGGAADFLFKGEYRV